MPTTGGRAKRQRHEYNNGKTKITSYLLYVVIREEKKKGQRKVSRMKKRVGGWEKDDQRQALYRGSHGGEKRREDCLQRVPKTLADALFFFFFGNARR